MRALMEVGLAHYLVVGAALFSLGLFIVVTRRQPLAVLMGGVLMLNAAALSFVAFSTRAHGTPGGQVIALIIIVVAAAGAALTLGVPSQAGPLPALLAPRRAAAVALVVLAAAALGLALSAGGLLRRNVPADIAAAAILAAGAAAILRAREAERRAVLVVATLGLCVIASAADLLIVYLGVELLGLGGSRERAHSGIAASGSMLYGMALFYGAAGSTRFADVLPVLSSGPRALVVPAALFAAAGFAYKIVRALAGLVGR